MSTEHPTPADYGDYQTPATDTAARSLAAIVADVDQVDDEIASLEAKLAAASARRRTLVERKLPEAIDALGFPSVVLPDGRKVEVVEEVRASLPKDERRERAFAWLAARGQDGLIKRKIVIEFAKDDGAWADKFERDMAQRKRPIPYTRSQDIHNGTLCKFLREQLAEGTVVPLEDFGGFIQRIAKVKAAK